MSQISFAPSIFANPISESSVLQLKFDLILSTVKFCKTPGCLEFSVNTLLSFLSVDQKIIRTLLMNNLMARSTFIDHVSKLSTVVMQNITAFCPTKLYLSLIADQMGLPSYPFYLFHLNQATVLNNLSVFLNCLRSRAISTYPRCMLIIRTVLLGCMAKPGNTLIASSEIFYMQKILLQVCVAALLWAALITSSMLPYATFWGTMRINLFLCLSIDVKTKRAFAKEKF